MAEMGKYCKAYLAKQFREYSGWTENAANVRKEKKEVNGKEVEVLQGVEIHDALPPAADHTGLSRIARRCALLQQRGEGHMAEMGNYCKAYLLGQLRAYPGWSEKSENARVDDVDGKKGDKPRELDDDSIVYLQENYVVTDGIFKDENVLFDDVTDEWKEYCHSTLSFEIPVYEPIEIPQAEPEPAEAPAAETSG